MVNRDTKRREVLALLATVALLPTGLRAEAFTDLEWTDLLPDGARGAPDIFQSVIDHNPTAPAAAQPLSSGFRTDWNGQTVRLPGYIIPLEHVGTGVTAFILAPFVGACVHVPPPPANQLVFVTTSEPYESKGLFEAVNVTGMFGTASTHTQLAEIGYAISADRIEPF